MQYILKHRFSLLDITVISVASTTFTFYGWIPSLVFALVAICLVVYLENKYGI